MDDDMEMFWCKACKPCGEPKSKHKAQEHLVGQHGFPKAMVQSFLVVHDQHAIAKGRLSRCVLSECYARHIASNGVGRLEVAEAWAVEAETMAVGLAG